MKIRKTNSLLNFLPGKGKEATVKAFTLVELIVTLTILAILGIIAFISLQGYSESSRNSVRIRDISTMKTSLEVFSVNGGKYPEPTGGVDITYKSAQVRNQGTFGEDTRKNVSSLDKIPKDPLTDTEYAYSLLNTKLEYEIGGIMEGGEISQEPKITKEVLALKKANAYIKGTYNGIVAKVSTGGTTYALAIPTIIGTDINELTLEGQLANKKLAYNGTTNVPSSYGESYSHEGGFDYHSTDVNGIIVYSGALSALGSSGTLMQEFIGNLQLAYSGTYATLNPDILNLVSTDLTDTGSTEFIARVLLNQTIDPSVQVTGALSSSAVDGGDEEGGSTLFASKIALGGYHSCILTNGGGVKCWGYNGRGQLGDSTTEDKIIPIQVPGLESGIVDIISGYYHNCALTSLGGVKCWGWNTYGQIGNGSSATSVGNPVDVTGLTSGVISIKAGVGHSCAILSAGGVKCWGQNTSGQLGNGGLTNSTTAVNVIGLSSNVSSISLGGQHSCALLDTGAVQCWGSNGSGQLGNGNTTNSSTPINVTGISGVTSLVSGNSHNCTIINGGVKCWGANNYGQLGINSTTYSPTAVNVSGLTSGVSYIAVGGSQSCVLLEAGGVKCWGYNNKGQLGDLSVINRLIPTTVEGLNYGIETIVVGDSHMCAIIDGGLVKCWGDNLFGQLGNGKTFYARRLTPYQIGVTGFSKYKTTKFFLNYSCIITSGGGIKCWGDNTYGQLGDGSNNFRLIPTDVLGLTSGVSDIALGNGHTCAVLTNGSLKCWGTNAQGQIGDGTTTQRLTPVEVISSGVSKVELSDNNSCVLLTNGSVKCWGINGNGQLGDGTNVQKLIPTQVNTLTSGIKDISIGQSYACALNTSGGVKCWGVNQYGQLGDGTLIAKSTPTQVTNMTSGVSDIELGVTHSCALLTDGTVKCWGDNNYGKSGDKTIAYQAKTPILVKNLSGATQISASNRHTCAVVTGSTVRCWCMNSEGELGNGTTNRSDDVMVTPIGLDNVSRVDVGTNRSCATKNDGTLWCWGTTGIGLNLDASDYFDKVSVDLGE